MTHSLEARVPYLDHRFVEFCARLDPEQKIRGTMHKHLLKRVARTLPAARDHRPRQAGLRDAADRVARRAGCAASSTTIWARADSRGAGCSATGRWRACSPSIGTASAITPAGCGRCSSSSAGSGATRRRGLGREAAVDPAYRIVDRLGRPGAADPHRDGRDGAGADTACTSLTAELGGHPARGARARPCGGRRCRSKPSNSPGCARCARWLARHGERFDVDQHAQLDRRLAGRAGARHARRGCRPSCARATCRRRSTIRRRHAGSTSARRRTSS